MSSIDFEGSKMSEDGNKLPRLERVDVNQHVRSQTKLASAI